MKIQFNEGFTAFCNGPLTILNNGEPIEPPPGTENLLLGAMAVRDGETVNVFRPAEEARTPKKKGDK